MIPLKHKERELSIIGTCGVGGLLAYLMGVLQGYMRGFSGEHRAVKWVGRAALLVTAFALVFTVISAPGLQLPKDPTDIASVAQAAEEEKATDIPEETAETAATEDVLPQKTEKVMEATESESAPAPLDDSILEPSDVYAEKGQSAVFRAYHPQAEAYQWEIYDTEAECWGKAPQEAVTDSQDELLREISSLELQADQEQRVRCQISTAENPTLTYEADLHILPGKISSISVDKVKAEAGEYVPARDIPVQVTYQDGSQEEITGLSGLYFLEQSQSSQNSITDSGNVREMITTIRTACEYDQVDPGSQEGLLCYRPSVGETMDIPIAMTGLDLAPPQIQNLTVYGYEISTVDQPVPVTVTIRAVDEVTPTRQLEYAFLPEGEDVQDAEWTKEPTFTAEITKNGLWMAFCRDESGNIASKEQSLVVVDNKAPIVTLSLENQGWCMENVIYVSAEDSLSVEYRYLCEKTGEDSGWISEATRNIGENGEWKIQVRDAVGNIAEHEITVDNIDTQAPVIRSITEKTEGETISNEK